MYLVKLLVFVRQDKYYFFDIGVMHTIFVQ